MNGPEIAAAFMQQNDKRTWKARNVNRARNTGAGDVVHFESSGGMVSLMYYVESGRFAVKFNKFHGAWGDYIKAIARSLFVVLNTLKSAGLPFDAPPTLAGMVIEATTTDDNLTYVAWPGANPSTLVQRFREAYPEVANAGCELIDGPYDPEAEAQSDGGAPGFGDVSKLPPVL